jgi:glycerophosphoryl diester phosphodiesterase
MGICGGWVVPLGVMVVASSTHGVEVVCHRGANDLAPENTLAASQECVNLGVDYIEVDVRTSKDGVMYILHDPFMNRTTNGKGFIGSLTSEQIDALDAGSWFSPRFAGEKVPRLETFLKWVKGKSKVYFDVKSADLEKLVRMVRDLALEKDCFFWFGRDSRATPFRKIAPDLSLKINAYSPEQVDRAKKEFNAQIIECGLGDLTSEFREACRRNEVKIMVLQGENEPEAFSRIIESGVEMVNLNHPDVFIKIRDEMKMPK